MEFGGYTFVRGDFNCVTRTTNADPLTQPEIHGLQRDQLKSLCSAGGRPRHARQYTTARLDHLLTPMDLREWVKLVQGLRAMDEDE